MLGLRIHVDPAWPLVVIPCSSEARGAAAVRLPLTGVPAGIRTWHQFVWSGTPSCGGSGSLNSSNAVSVTVQ
jgi:hypothetical protein